MRHLAFYGLFRLGVGLLGFLPGRLAVALGERAGRVAYYFGGQRRRMAVRHMRRVLGEDADLPRAARKVFACYGRYWAEALWVRPRRRAAVVAATEVEGIEWVRKAKTAGRGMVFALPHVGNWEIAGPIAGGEGVELVAVAERLTNRYLLGWFARLRAHFGIDIVLADGTSGLMRRLTETLRHNGAVALLCDRDLSGRGVPVRFFGEITTLPAGPATLALRSGAALMPVASYFRDGGHRVVIHPPLEGPLDRGDQVAEYTQRLATALEGLVRAAPEQWHLVQPNWPSDRYEGHPEHSGPFDMGTHPTVGAGSS